MSAYIFDNFLCNTYSEDICSIAEPDYDEVMNASAVDGDWQGYSEGSRESEREAWQGSKQFSGILIKKACEHSQCSHFKCERGLRLGGIDI
jgi:hypothetical protein